jgi:site-specific DNA recombinase
VGEKSVINEQNERHEMTPRTAVIYTRVSSREQEQEGFSLDAQSKLLRAYADQHGLKVLRTFEDIETAKTPGRKHFGEMLEFFNRNRGMCQILLVEKTDRLYRNTKDAVKVEDLDIETHFVKENQVISKNSRSQDRFMHDIRLAVARNYSENLREEVKKGMLEKAEQGTYPGRVPFGYRNNKGTRTIEIDPERSAIARYVFERYATGRYSLLALSKDVRHMWGVRISKTNLHKMLTNPFYIGQFNWQGCTYRGTHELFVSSDVYAQAHAVLHGHNKPKYRKHDIAFRGLLTCAHDSCTVTAELKKNKYVYYRCSGGRGPCELPRFREQEIAEKFGDVVRSITIPPEVAHRIVEALEREHKHMGAHVAQQHARLNRELDTLHTRMDTAYYDKLDGKITEEFWQRKQAVWTQEEQRITLRLATLKEANCENDLANARRILELAQNAYSQYFTRRPAEQAELLRNVLLNCEIDGANLYPSYRKPFDVIAERVKSEEWSGREDLNLRPPGPEPGALPG